MGTRLDRFRLRRPRERGWYTVVPAVKQSIQQTSAGMATYGEESMEDVIGDSLSARRFTRLLLGTFAVLALGARRCGHLRRDVLHGHANDARHWYRWRSAPTAAPCSAPFWEARCAWPVPA